MDMEVIKLEFMSMTQNQRRRFRDWLTKVIQKEETRTEEMMELGPMALSVIEEILGEPLTKARDSESCNARMVISCFLIEKGWKTTQIGELLGKDRSTICVILRNAEFVKFHPGLYPEYTAMDITFNRKIKQRLNG